MDTNTKGRGSWLHNRDLLLVLISALSLLLFFLCLLFVPHGQMGEWEAFMRGCAVLLSLGMPSFFYLRSAGNEESFSLGALPPLRRLWRVIVLLVGALLLGVLLAAWEAFLGIDALFTVFLYPRTFSLSSLASLIAYAFGTAFLPFGLLAPHVKWEGGYLVLLPTSLLYAAFSFSTLGWIGMLVFGVVAALVYLQYESFLLVFLLNLFFLFGGYAATVGWLPVASLIAYAPALLLSVLGVLTLAALLVPQDYRLLAGERGRTVGGKRKLFLWLLFGVLSLALCVLLSLFVLKNIG